MQLQNNSFKTTRKSQMYCHIKDTAQVSIHKTLYFCIFQVWVINNYWNVKIIGGGNTWRINSDKLVVDVAL